MAKRTNRAAWGLVVALVGGSLSLGAICEKSPRFWSAIANTPAFSRFHRRRAVFHLFRWHVSPGMQLSELKSLLNHPTWLRDTDIDEVTILKGQIPVEVNFKDTVFVLVVLPDPGKDTDGIFLRVGGKVELEQFKRLLLGTGKATLQARTTKIVEMGLCEDPRERPCEHKGSRT